MGILQKFFSCISTGKPKEGSSQKGIKQQKQQSNRGGGDQNRGDITPKTPYLDPSSQFIQSSNEEQKNQTLRKGFMKENHEGHQKQNDLQQSQQSIKEKKKKCSNPQLQNSSSLTKNQQQQYNENENDRDNDQQQNMEKSSTIKQQKQNSQQEFSDKKLDTSNHNNNNNNIQNGCNTKRVTVTSNNNNNNNNSNMNQQQQKNIDNQQNNSEVRDNNQVETSSQTNLRTKNHKQSNITTEQGSLDSTKVSLNQSQVTNNHENNSQEEYAIIDKQIIYLKSLEESKRAEQEEQIIHKYISSTTSIQKNALSLSWGQKFSDCIKDKKIMKEGIDNTAIADQDGNLKAGLKIDRDYLLVSNQVWYFLTQLYGGGPHVIIQNNPEKLQKLLFQPFRLENNSNYCYMNACLQSIFSIGEMNRYFFEKKYLEYQSSNTKKKFKFSHAYYDALEKFNTSNIKMIVNPSSFKKYSSQNFDPFDQHDAQEYLRFVLGEIQDELNYHLPAKRPSEFADSESAWDFYFQYHTSIVDRLFCGQLISRVQCQKCKHISSTFDPFLDLSLPIESKSLKDIHGCLDNFFKQEEIDGDYKCEKCKKTSRALKSCQLGKIPKYLVIHLKRFKIFPSKTKIKQQITYPPIIDISKYYFGKQNESTQYALNTVIIHSGTVEYGHYVSFNKRNNNKWYFCDDDNIQECNLKDALDQEAYLLFYERI